MILIFTFLGITVFFAVILVLPWLLTYIPGKKEDREWVNHVWSRTKNGNIYWWTHSGDCSKNKVLRGRDISRECMHELHIIDFSSRFLYSYSMIDAEDDGYVHNKKQLAYVPINPWRPLNRLVKEVLKQLYDEPYKPVDIITPGLCGNKEKQSLFGLDWGEEPGWRKDVRLQ